MRTAHRQQPQREQQLDHEIGIGRAAGLQVADRGVDAVGGEIGEIERRRDPCVDLGLGRDESVETGHQPFGGEARGRADHQNPVVADLLQRRHRLPDLAETRMQPRIQEPPSVGQLDASGTPNEQREAQHFLEPADLVAERGGRHMQFLARPRQAEMARRGLERAQGGHWRHRLRHEKNSNLS